MLEPYTKNPTGIHRQQSKHNIRRAHVSLTVYISTHLALQLALLVIAVFSTPFYIEHFKTIAFQHY
ncbi:hypothetical protein D3C76_1011510 [compost metagenome]